MMQPIQPLSIHSIQAPQKSNGAQTIVSHKPALCSVHPIEKQQLTNAQTSTTRGN